VAVLALEAQMIGETDRQNGFYWVVTNGDDGKPLPDATPEPAEWNDGHWYGIGCEMPMTPHFFTVLSDRLEPPHG
jgi:hypothetical protein